MTFGPKEETAMSVPPLEQHAINHLIARLLRRYAGRYDEATIRRTVEELERQYQVAQVHTFVPLLIERDAKRILDSGR